MFCDMHKDTCIKVQLLTINVFKTLIVNSAVDGEWEMPIFKELGKNVQC